MPAYTLTYFDRAGKGEAIRYLLSVLGVEFEDQRIKQESWNLIKPTTPFGKLPTLRIGDRLLAQSTAICRYLGRKAGLGGEDEWEDLQIDMVVETYNDLRQAGIDFATEKNRKTKANKLEVLFGETYPFYFGKFDDMVKENNGYLANGKLTWADIYFVASAATIKTAVGYDYTKHFGNLKRLEDQVNALPQIKKWNESRTRQT